jgi:Tol biopolymer transport system component
VAGRLRWVSALALLVVLAASPALAQATLTFLRGPLKPVVWVAEDDGSQAHRLAPGTNARVSPDGKSVAYSPVKDGIFGSELVVEPVDGSTPARRLLGNARELFYLAWSPDSSTIAALRGSELGARRLVLIDVASGVIRTVAGGYFGGFSFAPGGGQLVYAMASKEEFPARSDIYRFDIPIGQAVRFAPPVRLTHDHRSQNPLWGPNNEIVYVKQLGAKQRRYGPKNELFLMNPAGKGVRRLTHTKVDPLLQGLYPTAWSANGKRLLAEFEGQDTSYAVTVNPRTGAQRSVTKAREQGFAGTALSADGKSILGMTGGFEPGPRHKVLSIPYGGGQPKILAKNAFEPDWSR